MEVKDLPDSITPIKLTWEEVQEEGYHIKPYDTVREYVLSLIKDNYGKESTFQGTPNTWIERDLVVYSKQTEKNSYGEKHTFLLMDANQNFYQWATNAKNYEVGASMHLKMKVKSHTVVDNVKTTIVWYCKES
jgi:hypothetical protein